MKELVGRKIERIFVNGDQSRIFFETDRGGIAYDVDGECCSESWFADVIGTSALIGGTVSKVEKVNMEGYNVDDGRTRQEVDEAYGFKITTDKGYCDIVFRNSSNGYYGGDIFDAVMDAERPKDGTEIVTDWNA